jgi:hypothetical protein
MQMEVIARHQRPAVVLNSRSTLGTVDTQPVRAVVAARHRT